MSRKRTRIVVAMSGGVDSSVAAVNQGGRRKGKLSRHGHRFIGSGESIAAKADYQLF